MLHHPLFTWGISIFLISIATISIKTLMEWTPRSEVSLQLSSSIAFINLIALMCFIISYIQTPDIKDLSDLYLFYESIFWAGGHILQFSFVQMMIYCWITLANKHSISALWNKNIILSLIFLQCILVVPAPVILLSYDDVFGSMHWFTQHMQYAGGIVATIMAIPIFLNWTRSMKHGACTKSCLGLSIILFSYGGLLALAIEGSNAIIPAHYHGSIVGISLAAMGLLYHRMPQWSWAAPKSLVAKAQPWISGVGQILHITGLAWMGGYGALRKDAGSSPTIDTVAGKLMFFSGGVLALIGGLMFVIVMIQMARHRSTTSSCNQ